MRKLAMGLLGVCLATGSAQAQTAAGGQIAASERAHTNAALARLADADTVLQLTAEGALLYQQDDLKLDGYQYCSQAVALAERGEFRRSVQAASKALHLGLRSGNDDLVAKAHRDMAIAYSYAGQLQKAEETAHEALRHSAKDPTQVVGPAHKVIGDVQARRGESGEAIASYQLALAGSSERYRPLVQASLVNALIGAGELAQARSQFDALPPPAEPVLLAQFERTRAKLLLAENRSAEALAAYRALADAEGGIDGGYNRLWALDGVARSQLALGDKPAAAAAFDQAIASLDTVRARFRSEEFKMGLFSDVQTLFEDAILLQSELGHASRAFELSERSRARALLDDVRDRGKLSAEATTSIGLAALQGLLQPDERVVEFHTLEDRLLAWVISERDIREVSYPLARADLGVLVEAFRNAIISGSPTVVQGADQVGALLLGPLALEAGWRLVIVPHGPLHYLPFQALRDRGSYLIERNPVAMAPSISIAAQLAASGGRVRPVLVAFGNPEVGPEYALPGSEAEVKALVGLFPGAKAYLNADASKSRFTLSAADARLLHVAAHAEADRVDPLYSRILLANEGGRQNFLEAHEVLALNLDGVALVTLSACESGLGRVADGDEVLGFSRVFLAAGSSALIASLWPVADDATELLMSTLYGELAKGVDLQRAMQTAQLTVLKQPGLAHPFFWAPFDVIGNWRLTVGG